MQCVRCQTENAAEPRAIAPLMARSTWCAECEQSFDEWSRRYASDIIWYALAGMIIVLTAGMLIPALGVSWLFALSGVFAGFGTILGLARWNRKRRRAQFLRGAAMPRAYLPEQT